MLLAEYEANICGCGCGQPVEVAFDKKQPFVVDKFVCQARRAIEKVRRDERAAKKGAPEGWDDGLHYYATPHEIDPSEVKTRGGARGD